jgi:hypothetical protein
MALDRIDLRVQAGKQSVWGTAVPTTVMLRGLEDFTIAPDIDIRSFEDMSLALAGSNAAGVYTVGGGGNGNGWCSYEHLCYWLDSLFGEATPGAPNYTYAYVAPVSTAPTPRIMTLQLAHSSVGGYAVVGGIVNELTLTQEMTEPLTFDVSILGNKVDADTRDALAIPVVNPITGLHLTHLYIDTWATAPGTTDYAPLCAVRRASLNVNANRTPRYCFGQVGAGSYRTDPWDGTLELTLDFDASSKAIIDSIVGGTLTQRNVKLLWDDTANRQLALTFAGVVTDMPDIFEDDDGVTTVSLTLAKMYNANWTTPYSPNWIDIKVKNQLTTLP